MLALHLYACAKAWRAYLEIDSVLSTVTRTHTHKGSAAAVRDQAERVQYENSDPETDAFVPLSTET